MNTLKTWYWLKNATSFVLFRIPVKKEKKTRKNKSQRKERRKQYRMTYMLRNNMLTKKTNYTTWNLIFWKFRFALTFLHCSCSSLWKWLISTFHHGSLVIKSSRSFCVFVFRVHIMETIFIEICAKVNEIKDLKREFEGNSQTCWVMERFSWFGHG